MKKFQSSDDEEPIKRVGKRKSAFVISASESDDGKTHLRMLTVDQLDENEVTIIEDDDADEDKDDSKFWSNF